MTKAQAISNNCDQLEKFIAANSDSPYGDHIKGYIKNIRDGMAHFITRLMTYMSTVRQQGVDLPVDPAMHACQDMAVRIDAIRSKVTGTFKIFKQFQKSEHSTTVIPALTTIEQAMFDITDVLWGTLDRISRMQD